MFSKFMYFSVIYHVFSFLFYQPFEPEFPIESVGSTICKLSLYLVSINKNIVDTFFCSLSLPAIMNLLVFFISVVAVGLSEGYISEVLPHPAANSGFISYYCEAQKWVFHFGVCPCS